MKTSLKIAASSIGVVGFLALASYLTTSIQWIGGFPQGEFRITLHDPNGMPIKGAILRVFHRQPPNLAFGYPLDNFIAGQDLSSDENGRITALRNSGGGRFGGHRWTLFWIYPMGDQAPEFDCEISADGFKPLKFHLDRLFESPHVFYEDFPKTKMTFNGREIELKIYEHSFYLERAKS